MARIRRETYRDGQVVVDEIEVPDEHLREQALNARADQVLAELQTLATSVGSMTSAQLSAAVRTLAGALLTLARLHWRRFDGTD